MPRRSAHSRGRTTVGTPWASQTSSCGRRGGCGGPQACHCASALELACPSSSSLLLPPPQWWMEWRSKGSFPTSSGCSLGKSCASEARHTSGMRGPKRREGGRETHYSLLLRSPQRKNAGIFSRRGGWRRCQQWSSAAMMQWGTSPPPLWLCHQRMEC